jgi:hypothetical protein
VCCAGAFWLRSSLAVAGWRLVWVVLEHSPSEMPVRATKITVCGILTSLTKVDVPQTVIMGSLTHMINSRGWAAQRSAKMGNQRVHYVAHRWPDVATTPADRLHNCLLIALQNSTLGNLDVALSPDPPNGIE